MWGAWKAGKDEVVVLNGERRFVAHIKSLCDCTKWVVGLKGVGVVVVHGAPQGPVDMAAVLATGSRVVVLWGPEGIALEGRLESVIPDLDGRIGFAVQTDAWCTLDAWHERQGAAVA